MKFSTKRCFRCLEKELVEQEVDSDFFDTEKVCQNCGLHIKQY